MTLERYRVPLEFKSDGCTVPRLLRYVFKKYNDDCRWHDWARRHLVHYGVLTVQNADAELYRRWVARGMWRWFARMSWNLVKMKRGKYLRTEPVPKEWMEYVYPSR